VVFSLTVLAIILGVPSLYYSYLGSRNATVRPLHPAEQADKSEQALRVYVAQFIPSGAMRFWSVRNDVKQYFPTDIFMLMRFTNLTKEEIQFDSVNVEMALKSNRPLKLFLLAADDDGWHTYCGLTTTFVVPCTFDRPFLGDVLRQPISPGHTVYGIGLFQVPRGRVLSSVDIAGLKLRLTDMRGKTHGIDAVLPRESPPGTLEQFTIKNSHPVFDISKYAEQRPLSPD
jgi:hypothetical protein